MKQSKNQQNWNQIISDWEASGQSQSAFCKERNLSIARFGYYRTRQLHFQENSAQTETRSQFIEAIPLALKQKSSILHLEITSNGCVKLQLNIPGMF